MDIVKIISAIFQLLLIIISAKAEKDKERKARMEIVIKEISNGIKKRDSSAITLGFSKLHNK